MKRIEAEEWGIAIENQYKIINLVKKVYEENSAEYAEACHFMAYYLANYGKYDEAIKYAIISSDLYKNLGDEYFYVYTEVLEKVAFYNYVDNYNEISIQTYLFLLNEYINREKPLDETFEISLQYLLSILLNHNREVDIDNIVEYYLTSNIAPIKIIEVSSDLISFYRNDSKKAIEYFKRMEAIINNNPTMGEFEKWGDALFNLRSVYLENKDYDKARTALDKATNIYKLSNTYKQNEVFIECGFGDIEYETKNLQNAHLHYERAYKSASFNLANEKQKLIILGRLGYCCLQENEIMKAWDYTDNAFDIISNSNEKTKIPNETIVDIISNYGSVCQYTGMFSDAVAKIDIILANYKFNDDNLQLIYLCLGKLYAELGEYGKAREYADNVNIHLNNHESESRGSIDDQIDRITQLSSIYYNINDLSTALYLLKNKYELLQETVSWNSSPIYRMLNNLALYYIEIRELSEAKHIETLCIAKALQNNQETGIPLFEIYCNMQLISYYQMDFEMANYYAIKAYETMIKNNNFWFPRNSSFYSQLLTWSILSQDVEKANQIGDFILKSAKLYFGNNAIQFYKAIFPLISLYKFNHDYSNLKNLCEMIINVVDESAYKFIAYYDLIEMYVQQKDYSKVITLYTELYDLCNNDARLSVNAFDSQERLSLIESIRGNLISLGSNLCILFQENYAMANEMGRLLYDSNLLFKGLNLFIDDNLYNNPDFVLEIPNSKMIKQYLTPNECAIEFVEYATMLKFLYGAILMKGDGAYNFIPLCSLDELKELDGEFFTKDFSCKIWGKILPYLTDIKTIYFAPAGEFHQIPIEYMPNPVAEGMISDRFNLHRLSSTREIVLNLNIAPTKEAVVYGGIKYDTDVATMETESRKYERPKHRGFSSYYSLGDSLALRGSLEYLNGSLIEAENIDGMMKENNYNSTFLSGNDATEESFKNLSGKANGIIHISTHGFYWTESEAERKAGLNDRLMFMSQLGDNARRNVEDKALTRTGLFMAGAKNALGGIELSEDVDDGILTAQEIANLDLRGIDLVVLSACQTGMGDISGDGVFGLQRGFKKAGANTILMSLWDVSDEATQILMTNFYKNYLGGMSKQQALRDAQKTVRETPGFSDPEYWAAFILLDGLD